MVIVVVQVSSEENVHKGHEGGGFIYSWHVHTSEWTADGVLCWRLEAQSWPIHATAFLGSSPVSLARGTSYSVHSRGLPSPFAMAWTCTEYR